MCGRYFLEDDIEILEERYGVKNNIFKGFIKGEIFPTNGVPIIINDESNKIIEGKWKFPLKGLNKKLINARIETINEKVTFKNAFYSRRCIVPANAFFEWKTENKKKIKYKISIKDQKVFSMAGIYNIFQGSDSKHYIGFVIVTTEANEEMSKLHHRMPLFIKPEYENQWLDSKVNNRIELKSLVDNLVHQKVNLIFENCKNDTQYVQLSF
jgi:putative SOS response-associated peptidase YedK